MEAPILHRIHGQNLWLSALRGIFWEEQRTLILSDLHFGKTGHFRKSGIPVPQNIYKEDLQRLVDLTRVFNASRMLVVGDFFHSKENSELDWFRKWRMELIPIPITLIKGNHDILKDKWYQESEITVIKNDWEEAPFHFTHERCEDHQSLYTFCGHIHPSVHINGLGKQSLRFPCFHFSSTHCTLPAFGRFTGSVSIHPQCGEQVFAVVEQSLIRIQ